MFIMLDGIDGSGKDTVNDAWKNFLLEQGKKIFDLKKYWLENKKYPEIEGWSEADIIFSAEPTYVGVGQVIRGELIRNGTNYPAEAVAHAFSLDRLILYTKVLVPAIEKNKIIIQVRGLSSSMAYQSTQNPELTLEKLSQLPGNKFALQHRPDYLVLMDISAESALERLTLRSHKQDDAIFEKSEFLKKLITKYKSSEFEKVFTDQGTIISRLSAEEKIDIMKENSINFLTSILKV